MALPEKKFSRDGDIGADPESSFYLQPAYCVNNVYDINANSFTLHYGGAGAKKLEGIFPQGMQLHTANPGKQSSPLVLDQSTATDTSSLDQWKGIVEEDRYPLPRYPAANGRCNSYGL